MQTARGGGNDRWANGSDHWSMEGVRNRDGVPFGGKMGAMPAREEHIRNMHVCAITVGKPTQ